MIQNQIFISTVFLAGFLSFFAPCTFPLIPVYVGIITDSEESGHHISIFGRKISLTPIIKTALFVAGLSTTFITLGFGAGALGRFISGSAFIAFSGLIVIILGLHQMEIIRIKQIEKYKVLRIKKGSENRFVRSFLLGLTFSFGWTPCVGPILGAVVVASAAGGGRALYGGTLMMVYSIGLMIPFLIMAMLSTVVLSRFEKIEKHLGTIKKVGGLLIVVMGILLMTQNLGSFAVAVEKLFN